TRGPRNGGGNTNLYPLASWVIPFVLITLFMGAAVPLTLTSWHKGRAWYDQRYYHEATIRAFARQWPYFDFRDYWSATTPGYHLAMAAVARFITESRTGLQLAGMAFTVGLLAL